MAHHMPSSCCTTHQAYESPVQRNRSGLRAPCAGDGTWPPVAAMDAVRCRTLSDRSILEYRIAARTTSLSPRQGCTRVKRNWCGSRTPRGTELEPGPDTARCYITGQQREPPFSERFRRRLRGGIISGRPFDGCTASAAGARFSGRTIVLAFGENAAGCGAVAAASVSEDIGQFRTFGAKSDQARRWRHATLLKGASNQLCASRSRKRRSDTRGR